MFDSLYTVSAILIYNSVYSPKCVFVENENDFQMVPDDTALADEATEEDEGDEKNAQANKEKQL